MAVRPEPDERDTIFATCLDDQRQQFVEQRFDSEVNGPFGELYLCPSPERQLLEVFAHSHRHHGPHKIVDLARYAGSVGCLPSSGGLYR